MTTLTTMYGPTFDDTATSKGYIKCPAGTLLTDGYSVDAGSMMIIAQNINHCLHENCKQLISDLGPAIFKNVGDGFDDNVEFSQDAAGTATNEAIAWTQNCSRRYGPFFIPTENWNENGLPYARKLLYYIEYFIDEGQIGGVYLAVTKDIATPNEGYLAIANKSITTGGTGGEVGTFTGTLTFTENVVKESFLSTIPATNGPPERTTQNPYYIWVGWEFTTANTSGILSISVTETRGA